ncbi:aldehyde dehydrogenase family protein [Arthrobacter sp. TE12232]
MTISAAEGFAVRRAQSHRIDPSILPPKGQFIRGRFIPSNTDATTQLEDPATGNPPTTVAAGSVEDADAAVAAAVDAKDAWAHTTPRERSDALHRIANIIEANRGLLEELESANTGKPAAVAEDDISSTIYTFRFTAGATRSLTSLAAGDYATGHTSVIFREPVGVVGVITPWNYPLLMAAWKIAPVLGAENTLVLKPSEQTTLTTLKLANPVQ